MQTRRIGRSVGLLLAALLMLQAHSAVAATAAAQQLKQTTDAVLAILTDPALKGEAKTRERRDKLKQAIASRFDFAEMAKRSLGAQWQKRSPAEQKEFVELFTELIESSYLDKIESYSGEKVRFVTDRQDKDFAEIGTKVIDNKGEEFSVDYRMYNANGDWKVSDVVIENISLVSNYRAQFNRLLTRSSYAELLEAMKQKKLSAPGAKS